MKKIIYVFALIAISTVLLSNSGGYAASSGEGLTGAPGDTKQPNGNAKTCQNCHNSGTFNPAVTISLLDQAGTTAVTKYEPGKTYTIRVSVNAGSGTPSGYGFQMIDIKKSDNSNMKGFVTTQASGIQLSTLSNGRVYAEQSSRSTSKTFDVKWKAPASGAGIVTFYAVGNAVDGKNGESGDNGTSSVSLEFPELTSGINDLAAQVKMNIVPNPATEGVELSLNSISAKTIQVRLVDMSGKSMIAEKWSIQAGDNYKKLDVSKFPSGAYMIQVIENQSIVSKKVIKI